MLWLLGERRDNLGVRKKGVSRFQFVFRESMYGRASVPAPVCAADY